MYGLHVPVLPPYPYHVSDVYNGSPGSGIQCEGIAIIGFVLTPNIFQSITFPIPPKQLGIF